MPRQVLARHAYLAGVKGKSYPEWDNEKVTIMAEDPARLTDEGWVFFRPRQEEFYVIR